jgi:hypothetical protein
MSAAFFAAARVRKCVVPSGVPEVREAGTGVASGAEALAVMSVRFISLLHCCFDPLGARRATACPCGFTGLPDRHLLEASNEL